MPDADLLPLVTLAASLGAFHTVLGPDHYVPFVAMARAGDWSLRRTLGITTLCGVGHVLGSVAVGGIGIAIGWALGGMEAFEGLRGDLAGWLLLGFGTAYLLWGVHRALRQSGGHVHVDDRGQARFHVHPHDGAHEAAADAAHVEGARGPSRAMTPWILFVIFVFGPCEVLIPLLMVPAAEHSVAGVALVTATFGLATVGTMLVVVTLGTLGVRRFLPAGSGRWVHAVSGLAIAACGALILVGL